MLPQSTFFYFIFMNKSYAFLIMLSAATFLGACSKDDSATPTTTAAVTNLTAVVNSAQQVPLNSSTSTATGEFVGTYTSSNRQLAYTVTYRGFTPTEAHIHSGPPSAQGPVAIPFANLTSPITGTVTLSLDQANDLLNNRMYVNMHSAAYSNGEIRGDIKVK
jgi:CHRD domain